MLCCALFALELYYYLNRTLALLAPKFERVFTTEKQRTCELHITAAASTCICKGALVWSWYLVCIGL
jgi:hypothetical protein